MIRTFSLGFFLGTLVLLGIADLPNPYVVLGVNSALTALLSLLIYRYPANTGVKLGSIALIGVMLGASYALLCAAELKTHELTPEEEGQDLSIVGVILDIPEQRVDSTSFIIQTDSPEFRGRLSLTWYADKTTQPPVLKAGEQWQLVVRCKRPHGFSNPNGFDYEKWLFTQRISGSGYVRASVNNQRLAMTPRWSIAAIRQAIKQQLAQALNDSPMQGLVQGLAIGYTQSITPKQWDTLRKTGTVHLLAISGLHITMVAGLGLFPVMLIWWLFPSLNLYIPLRMADGLLGSLFATAYSLLAGMNIPTQRTLVMLLVMLAGLMLRRSISFSTSLSLALLLVLSVDPFAGLAVGFWLSFGTVGLLVYLSKRVRKPGKFAVVSLQGLLSLGTIPMAAGFFGMISLSAPLANLIAIPVVTFIVTPLVLLGIGLMAWLPAAAASVWQWSALLLEWLMQVLDLFAAWSWSSIYLPLIPFIWLSIALGGFLFLYLPSGTPARWLGLIGLLPLIYYQPIRPQWGEFKLDILDVGQGLASVVQTAEHTLVFDTGPKTTDTFDTGELVILPWLRGQGITVIDQLIISHTDNDHSGGADALIKGLPVKSLLVSSVDSQPYFTARQLCQAGQQWQWDGVTFSVLHPSQAFRQMDDNNRACVLRLSNGYHSVLLTADIEQPAETWLIQSQQVLQAEVLLVPHHGSKTSSSIDFIRAVQPQLAIVTSGYRNRFHHPHEAVLERYQQQHIRLINTIDTGALSLYFPLASTAWSETSWRLEQGNLWGK